MEVPIKTEYVRVTQVLLNLDFAADLFFDFGLDYFGFVEGFESENVVWFTLCADHVDTTEFAFTKGATHVEAMQVPFTSWAFSMDNSVSYDIEVL